MGEAGVRDNTVMAFGQMNEPPGTRFRVGHAALTMAEYFHDDARQDVLLLIDNIFRFVQAGMEVSGLMGQLPSRVGYQPSLANDLAELEERICTTSSGAISSVQAVYVPADDFTDPAAVHAFSHLSATIVLSRKRASEGLYPAIDPLQSNSEIFLPNVVGQRHYGIARDVRRTLANYEDLKDIIAMLSMEELSRDDRRTVNRARRLERFLTQPFLTTEQFTGREGRLVDIDETLDGCERIMNDEFHDHPKRALYMIGGVDEGVDEVEKADKGGREQEDFLSDMRCQAGARRLDVARYTLAQLADAELEQRMCDAFTCRLEQLGDEQREEILHHLNNGKSQASVRSAFDVPADQRERLRNLLHKTFETDADVSFERAADLICGLELDVGGYSFGWSVKDFLRDLEVKFSERLKGKH